MTSAHDGGRSVVFIHGLWLHASSWDPWITWFEQHGCEAVAPGWPGDGDTVESTRAHPEGLDDVGIAAVYDHYAGALSQLDGRPVVIGHSFGGLIAQELLAAGLAKAAVAIDPAPIKGVRALPFSQLRSAFPALGNPAHRKHTVSLTAEQFRYSFGNAISEEESDRLFARWTIPGPARPLFEDATANFHRHSPASVDTHLAARGPLLLTAGDRDHTVPAVVTREVHALYAGHSESLTDYHEFADRGHSLTIDDGWPDVAADVFQWLEGTAWHDRAQP